MAYRPKGGRAPSFKEVLRASRLNRLAIDQGYENFEGMLRDLYLEQRISIINLGKRLFLSEHNMRKYLVQFGIPLRDKGGPNNEKTHITEELLAEVIRDGVVAVAEKMGIDPVALNAKVKKYYAERHSMSEPKLDKKFWGDIFKAKDGTQVPADQYLVFLAKDNAFAGILPAYLAECEKLGCDEEHLQLVRNMIHNVQVWRKEHPDLCKNPDAKNEAVLP